METNVNYTIVGIFVISLFAAMVLGIIWLSAGFSHQQYSKYMVYMKESVSGLSVDSPVEYNGVDVGSVVAVTLNEHDPQIVEVLLNIASNTPITTATVATLKTRGVTGITFVSLKDENAIRKPLVIMHGQQYPIIKSGPSLFTRIDTALNELSMNLKDVSKAIQGLLDQENQNSIKAILQNMRGITRELNDNTGKMTIILNNTSAASRQFSTLIQTSTGAARMLETQTLPVTYRLLSNLENMTRDLAQVAADLKQNPSVIIRGSTPQPLGPGEKR